MRILETLGRPNADETFLWITGILEERGIPYQITGGVAGRVYGSRRDVNDIDLELPDERLLEIVPDVQRFIIEGPGHYRDERWDLEMMTLEHDGQIVDVCAARDVRIFDAHSDRGWLHMPADLSSAEKHMICGKIVPVVAPAHLAAYKRLLQGDHQRLDIEAAESAARERPSV